MNIGLILTIAQWSIVLLAMIFHFLLGIKRGALKTFYYLLSSVLVTLLLFLLISIISIQPFTNAQGLLELVESLTGRFLPNEIRDIIIDPAINPLIMGIIDLIIKIVVFIILYPLFKLIIKVTLIKWLWKVIDNTRTNIVNKNQIVDEETRIEINGYSQAVGGVFGAIRGLVSAFIFLFPILFILGTVDIVDDINIPTSQPTSTVTPVAGELDMVKEILDEIQAFNKQSLTYFTKDIKFDDRTIDEHLMNLVFNMNVVVDETSNTQIKVEIGKELKLIGGIFSAAMELNVLDPNFDFRDINHSNDFDAIARILDNVGDSDLIQAIIPIALDIADRRPEVTDVLGFSPSQNPFTVSAYNRLKALSWKNEVDAIKNAIDAILQIGSIQELLDYLDNPILFLELDNSAKRKIADALDALADLELLYATPIGVEYALRSMDLMNQITWTVDPTTYIHNELSFLLGNDYVQGEVRALANLIRVVFAESFNDFDYTQFLPDEDFNLDVFLRAEASAIISAALDGILEIDTIFNVLPFVVDYAIYTSDEVSIEGIAEDLSNLIRSESFSGQNEISHIKSIYEIIVRIGLTEFFDNNVEMVDAIDHILMEHANLEDIKQIIKIIFEDSYAINQVLDLILEPMLDTFVEDEAIRDLVKGIIIENDFSIGKELSTILDLVGIIYDHGSIGMVMDAIEAKDYNTLVGILGNFTQEEFDTLKTTLYSLQVLEYGAFDLVDFGAQLSNLDIIYVNPDATYQTIKTDLSMLLDSAYLVAHHITTEAIDINEIETVDLLNVLPINELKQTLSFSAEVHERSILLGTLVNYLKENRIEIQPGLELSIPLELADKEFNDTSWINEVNHVVGGVFDIIQMIKTADLDLEFTISTLSNLNGLNDLKASMISKLADDTLIQQGFGSITSSSILKSNLVNIINYTLDSMEDPIPYVLSNDYYLSDDLSSQTLTNLLSTIIKIGSAFIIDEEESLAYNIENLSTSIIIDRFNQLDTSLLTSLGQNKLINNNFRRILIDDGMHTYLYQLINDVLAGNDLPLIEDGIFNFVHALDETNQIKEDTLSRMLIAIRDLKLPSTIETLEGQAFLSALASSLTESWVEQFFDIELIHELVSNTLKHEVIKSVGETYFNNLLEQLSAQQIDFTLNYELYYDTILHALLDEDELLSTQELKTYVRAFYIFTNLDINLNNIQEESYNKLSSKLLDKTYTGNNLIEVITSSRLLRGVLGVALQDDNLLDGIAGYANTQLQQVELLDFEVRADELTLNGTFFDHEGLKQADFYQLFEAVLYQDLDIIKRQTFNKTDILNLVTIKPGREKDSLTYLYDSRIISFILEKTLNNERVHEALFSLINDQLMSLSEQLGLTLYEITTDDLEITYNWVDHEAVRQMIDVILFLDFEEFSELANVKSLEEVKAIIHIEESRDVIDEFVDIPLVYDLLTFIFSSDYAAKTEATLLYEQVLLPFDPTLEPLDYAIFKVDSEFITKEDFADLFVALLGVNVDVDTDFISRRFIEGLLTPHKVAGITDNSINHLLSSRIIHHTLSQALNSDTLQTYGSTMVNNMLSDMGFNTRMDKSLLALPQDVLDEHGLILPLEFTTLLESVLILNVERYTELTQLDSITRIKEVVPTAFFDKLFDSKLIHHVIDQVLQSEFSRMLIVEYVSNMMDDMGLPFNMDKDELSIPVHLLDNHGRIKKTEITDLIETLYMTKQESFDLSIIGTNDLKRILPFEAVSKFFDSGLIMHYLSTIIKSDATNEVLATLLNNTLDGSGIEASFTAQDFKLPDYVFNAQGTLIKEEIFTIVTAIYSLDIDDFNAISLSSPSHIETLIPLESVDDIFESRLIRFYLTQALQAESSREVIASLINTQVNGLMSGVNIQFRAYDFVMSESILDTNQLIRKDDLMIIVESFYDVNLESFDHIDLSSPYAIETMISKDTILNLYESNLIKFLLRTMTQSEPMRDALAQVINLMLEEQGVDAFVVANDFLLPLSLLDDQQFIKHEDISIILDTFFDLGISDFGSIEVGSPAEIETIINRDMISHLLDSKLAMYALSKPFTMEITGDIIASILNSNVGSLGFGEGKYVSSDFTLPKELITQEDTIYKSDMMALVDGFFGLGISSFSDMSFGSPVEISTMLPLTTFDIFMESRLLKFYITQALSVEGTRSILAEALNQPLATLIDDRFTANYFILPEDVYDQDGYIKTSNLRTLLETIYGLGIDSFDNINFDSPSAIQAIISHDDIMNVYDTELVKFYINMLIQSQPIRSLLAKSMNDFIGANGFDQRLDASDFILANHLLENGYVKRDEVSVLVRTFYGLGIESFGSIEVGSPAQIEVILPLSTVDIMLESRMLKYYMTKVATSRALQQVLASMTNDQIAGLGFNVSTQITYDTFIIPSHLLDEHEEIKSSDVRLLFEVFYGLGIDSFDSIDMGSPSAIEDILPLGLWYKLLYETDMIHYYIDKVIQHEVVGELMASIVNKMAQDAGYSISISASLVKVPDDAKEDGLVKKYDLFQLLSVFYQLGIDSFDNIPMNGPADIEHIMPLNLFEDILDISLIYETMNVVLMSNTVSEFGASFLSSTLATFGFDMDISPDLVKVPETALSEGKISKDELKTLLEIAYDLNVETFDELQTLSNPQGIKDLVTMEYLDKVLSSEIMYYLIGYVPQTNRFRSKLASVAQQVMMDSLDLNFGFVADDFLLNQHDVLYSTGTYNGYIKKEEILSFYNAFVIFDLESLEADSTFVQMNQVLDELTRLTYDFRMVIEVMFDSHILQTMVDRMFNIDASPHLQTGILDLISETLSIFTNDDIKLTPDDRLFKYHPSAIREDGTLDPVQVIQLVTGLKALQIEDEITLATFVDAIDRNYNSIEDMDDFDRFYQSMILQSLLSNLLLNDRFMNVLARRLNASQESLEFTTEMLEIPSSVVDEDVIDPLEMKKFIKVFGVLGFQDLDMSVVSIDLILSLEGRNEDNGVDDLDRVLDSKIFHSYIDRLVQSESFNQMVVDMVSDMFGKDVTGVNTKLTPDMLDEEGMFAKNEIRALFVSIKLLGVEQESDLETISLSDLVGLDNEDDDLELFLASNYIRVMIGRMLASKTIRDMIADAAGFNSSHLTLNTVNRDAYGEMSKDEVKQLIKALNVLGMDDFENIEFEASMLSQLSDEELDTLLDSNYFYQVISLTLEAQLEDSMTSQAKVDNGDYEGYVKKDEIVSLVDALVILDAENPSDIDPNTLSVIQLRELLELNSKIIQKLVSDALIDEINVPESVIDEDGIIEHQELEYLLDALVVIIGSEYDPIGDANISEISFTTTMLSQLLNIGIEDQEEGSIVITRMISEQVIENIENIPLDAYNGPEDIKREELYHLKDALFILGIEEITGSFNTDDMMVGQLKDVVELKSLIIRRLISNALTTTENPEDAPLLNVPSVSMDHEDMIIQVELENLVKALLIIYDYDLEATFGDMDMSNFVFTNGMFKDLLDIYTDVDPIHGSPLVTRLISESIISNLEDQLPEEAYETPEDIKRTELYNLHKALGILEIEDITGDKVTGDNMTVKMLRELIDIESVIIHKLISDTVIKEVDVPEVSMDGLYILKIELHHLADALEIILGGDDVKVLDMDLDNTPIETQMFGALLDIGLDQYPLEASPLVIRMISQNVLAIVDEIPLAAMNGEKDIKREELKKLEEALYILGIEEVTGNIDADTLTIDDLTHVVLVQSHIIRKLISDVLTKTDEPEDKPILNVPSVSMDDEHNLTQIELENLVVGLNIIFYGHTDETTVMDIDMANATISTDVLKDLLDIYTDQDPENGSPLITRLMSENVIAVFTNLPDDAYQTEAMEDIKRSELYHIVTVLDRLGLYDVTGDIDAEALDAETLEDIHNLNSIIFNDIISDAILAADIDIPDEAMDGDMVEYNEVGRLIKSIGVLNITVNGLDSFDPNAITFKMLEDVRLEGSLIIERKISDGLKANVPPLVIPAFVLTDDGHVEGEEIDHLIADLAQSEFNSINSFIDFIENVTFADLGKLTTMSLTVTSEILKATIAAKINEIMGI